MSKRYQFTLSESATDKIHKIINDVGRSECATDTEPGGFSIEIALTPPFGWDVSLATGGKEYLIHDCMDFGNSVDFQLIEKTN